MSQQNLKKDQIDLNEVCNFCGKAKQSQSRSFITSWIFRTASCTCKKGKSDTKAKDSKSTENKPLAKEIKTPEIEKYDVVDFIGQGGMGSVYKVSDKSQGQVCAIKVLRPEFVPDHIAVKRFQQEAIAASKLTHPNLVNVFDHGKTADGSPYIVMEYLEGESLNEYIERVGAVEYKTALDILIQTCAALSHAHTQGVIHRDLKPANIILSFNELGEVNARVVDFGIAKIQHDMRSTSDLTETGSVLGSPAYMSPEQCLGAQIDSRADLYSLGCVLFETLTGEELYSGENPVQVIAKHLEETPEKFENANIHPKHLKEVIRTCIQKDVNKRYQSSVELGIDLLRIKEGKEPEFCLLSDDKLERWTKKKPVIAVFFSVLGLIGLGGAMTIFPQIELISFLRSCIAFMSFIILGFSIAKVIKTVVTCASRKARVIDLATLTFFWSLLIGCFYTTGYCMSKFSGLVLPASGLETGIANSFVLIAFAAIAYLLIDRTTLKSKEYLQGKFNIKSIRAASTVLISLAFTLITFNAVSKTTEMLPTVESAVMMESRWVKSKETDYLSKLVIANDNANDNQDSKIANLYKFARAIRQFEQGNIQFAKIDFDAVIKNGGPMKDSALIERAVISFSLNNPKMAMQDIDNVLKHDPQNRDAMVTKALISLANFDSKNAAKYYLQAAKYKVTTTSTALTYFALVQNNEKQKALKFLNDWLKKNPDDKLVLYLLGRCSYAELVNKLHPDTKCNTNVLVGWNLLLQDKKKQAREKFQSSITYIKSNGFMWHHGIFYGLAKSGYKHALNSENSALQEQSKSE